MKRQGRKAPKTTGDDGPAEWVSDFKPRKYSDPSVKKKQVFRDEPLRRESPRGGLDAPLSPDSVTSSDIFDDYDMGKLPRPPLHHVGFVPPAVPVRTVAGVTEDSIEKLEEDDHEDHGQGQGQGQEQGEELGEGVATLGATPSKAGHTHDHHTSAPTCTSTGTGTGTGTSTGKVRVRVRVWSSPRVGGGC